MNETVITKLKTVDEIFSPLLKDLNNVKLEIREIIEHIFRNEVHSKLILKKLFDTTGKMLRPALVILSGKAAADNNDVNLKALLRLGAAVELIHNASLVHDDIIDDSDYRRNKLAVHKQYNNQIAVLAGDLLYTSALSVLSEEFSSEVLVTIVNCIHSMASTEIFCLSRDSINIDEYMKIIIGKTALFMASCCKAGAMITSADPDRIKNLKNFGMNFGIAYQLIDDFKDKDIKDGISVNSIKKAKEFADSALENISFIENEQLKEVLNNLVAYVVNTGS